jgi:hypothetical protein
MNEHGYWLAKLFGPYLTVLGIWMIFYHENLSRTYASIRAMPYLMYVRSSVNILFGLYAISLYNLWDGNLFLLVTLLGWAFLFRGLITLFIPKFAIKAGLSDEKILQTRGIFPLIWGLLLIWLVWGR